MKQCHFSFYGLWNAGDLRHLLYLASSAPKQLAGIGILEPGTTEARRGHRRVPTVGMTLSQFGTLKYF